MNCWILLLLLFSCCQNDCDCCGQHKKEHCHKNHRPCMEERSGCGPCEMRDCDRRDERKSCDHKQDIVCEIQGRIPPAWQSYDHPEKENCD